MAENPDAVIPPPDDTEEPPLVWRPPSRSAGGRVVAASRSYGPAALLLLALVGGWEMACRVFGVPQYVLAAPDQVATALWQEWPPVLASATWVTTEEIVLGFLLALVAAFFLAVLLHSSRIARQAMYPLLITSQTVPVVVIAPVLAIIFGYTIAPKLIVVALICFFPVVVNALDGLAGVDPQLLRMMRTLYGGRWSTFRRVELPSALPLTFSGMRVAATFAPIGAVFGEYAGSQDGLGYVMIQAIPQLQTALVFAAIVVLTVESIVLFALVSLAERVLCPWAHEGKR